ncbi:hypothetical protein B0H10DRAFT_2081013 [Mycena sp. CBHHK59/15]|nr:hypothetical protein B0H10DRAFT_2081013 [Mycena sp. CBHHK59/15]
MPTLRVLAGPTPCALTPITALVNTNRPHRIATDAWEGEIVVFIKGFNKADPAHDATPAEAEYFGREDRSGVTWSIQVQGRFLSPRSSDDILFGNIFERPLKLPWGTGAALKFMKFIDPTLSHDLTCTASQKPWALSPLVATMPYLAHTRLDPPCDENDPGCNVAACRPVAPPFPPPTSVTDDTAVLRFSSGRVSPASSSSSSSSLLSRSSASSRLSADSRSSHKKSRKRSTKGEEGTSRVMTSQQRRAYFSSEAHRKAVSLGPQDVLTTDFCYGFLEFAPTLRLRLPGGLGFDLARYWDGQGVRFVCCERRAPWKAGANADTDADPWGRVFWCVSIEMGEDGDGDEDGDG